MNATEAGCRNRLSDAPDRKGDGANSADVSVVIVNWNTRDILRRCLRSIQEQTRVARLELIVVDNASTDGSADMLRAEFPW